MLEKRGPAGAEVQCARDTRRDNNTSYSMGGAWDWRHSLLELLASRNSVPRLQISFADCENVLALDERNLAHVNFLWCIHERKAQAAHCDATGMRYPLLRLEDVNW